MGHQPKPEECECCAWPTDDLTETDAYARTRSAGPFSPDDQKEWAWLCQVCRSTHGGNVYLYPRNYPTETGVITSTINWGTNALLAAIREQANR